MGKTKIIEKTPDPQSFIPDDTFDFHQFDKLDDYLVEKYLTQFIEDCYHREMERLLIITGKGKLVNPLVGELLPKIHFVKSFKRAGYFNGGEGAYEIILH